MKSTNATFWITLGGGLMLLAPAFAQRVDNYRAQIRGGGRDREMHHRSRVDGVAEIEIRGDQGSCGRSGNPSAWRRMECNQPLPRIHDFRFSGVDGRGRQTCCATR
jgi:hypothetical protein